MKTENIPLPRMHLRQEELDSIMFLLCAVWRFQEAQEVMEKRLRMIPRGWWKIRMMRTMLDHMLTDLLNTVPPEKLVTLKALIPDTRVRITYTRQIGKGKDDVSGIHTRDLDLLCAVSHDAVCKLCDGNCDRCQLGKVFDRFLSTDRQKGESYTFINMEQGADVKGMLRGGTK